MNKASLKTFLHHTNFLETWTFSRMHTFLHLKKILSSNPKFPLSLSEGQIHCQWSDPSPITGNACHSLTNWLTDSCLVDFIDVTLACEDANSKIVDVVTIADDDRVGNNLLQISKLRFGQKAKIWFRFWAQGLVEILKLKLRQDFKL